jgi:hypothetical protein
MLFKFLTLHNLKATYAFSMFQHEKNVYAEYESILFRMRLLSADQKRFFYFHVKT